MSNSDFFIYQITNVFVYPIEIISCTNIILEKNHSSSLDYLFNQWFGDNLN